MHARAARCAARSACRSGAARPLRGSAPATLRGTSPCPALPHCARPLHTTPPRASPLAPPHTGLLRAAPPHGMPAPETGKVRSGRARSQEAGTQPVEGLQAREKGNGGGGSLSLINLFQR